MNQDRDNLFNEVQRFRQAWLWLLVGAPMVFTIGLFAWGLYEQLVLGKPFGDKPMTDKQLILTSLGVIIIGGGALALLIVCKLIVQVRLDGLYVQFKPFHLRPHLIPLQNVDRHEAVTYRPILEYGGWGIRWQLRGKAYNISGNRGVRLHYNNGRHLLIGSQRADELAAAITRLRT